jgi:hypothetical protein
MKTIKQRRRPNVCSKGRHILPVTEVYGCLIGERSGSGRLTEPLQLYKTFAGPAVSSLVPCWFPSVSIVEGFVVNGSSLAFEHCESHQVLLTSKHRSRSCTRLRRLLLPIMHLPCYCHPQTTRVLCLQTLKPTSFFFWVSTDILCILHCMVEALVLLLRFSAVCSFLSVILTDSLGCTNLEAPPRLPSSTQKLQLRCAPFPKSSECR